MLGAGVQSGRYRGENRFYDSVKARRNHHLQRAQSEGPVNLLPLPNDKSIISTNAEPEYQTSYEEPEKAGPVPAFEPFVAPSSNLKRFVESIRPSVSAQYPSKTTMRGWRRSDGELQPYFLLGDLWESFKEWSAYGAGVPLILNDSDCVVQYYVPYLSAIQIYCESTRSSSRSRRPGEDSDSDLSSDGISDYEAAERGFKYLRDHQITGQEGFSSSDESDSANPRGSLIFEYLEKDPPYSREPLADKISDLAFRVPELKTLRSCDLLSSSWISVAWYPIYRIPTGPTLKDLDACFLTFHSLHTPMRGEYSAQVPVVTYPNRMGGVPKIPLPVFGLASYKLKGSVWIPEGGCEREQANSLLQAADNWLRLHHVSHPDFLFFSRR